MNHIATVVLLGSMACAQVAPTSAAPSPATKLQGAPRTPGTDLSPDITALIPEPPPLPKGKASLIGGRIRHLDRVRDQITVHVFGGSNMKVLFDGRTRVYRDGVAASYRDLQNGQRVYLDTLLDGTKVFAKNIHVVMHGPFGESSGQVVSFQRSNGELIVRDPILPEPVKLRVSTSTQILRDGRPVSPAQLQKGALVSVQLRPDGDGKGLAHQVTILANPGETFVFAGRVTDLDLHSGLLVLLDPRDQKTYELRFDPAAIHISNDLQQGAEVTATAGFDGSRYFAKSVTVNSPAGR